MFASSELSGLTWILVPQALNVPSLFLSIIMLKSLKIMGVA